MVSSKMVAVEITLGMLAEFNNYGLSVVRMCRLWRVHISTGHALSTDSIPVTLHVDFRGIDLLPEVNRCRHIALRFEIMRMLRQNTDMSNGSNLEPFNHTHRVMGRSSSTYMHSKFPGEPLLLHVHRYLLLANNLEHIYKSSIQKLVCVSAN